MKENLKKIVDQALPDILNRLGVELRAQDISYTVERPTVRAFGDVSINLGFHLGRRLGKNPYEVAGICKQVMEQKIKGTQAWRECVEAITVERPGFINFKLTPFFIVQQLHDVRKKDDLFGRSSHGRATKVLLEFVSANPTGPLTIAHGRQAAIGDALARILRAVGFKPYKEFYLNDSGRQTRLLGESLHARYDELFGLKSSIPKDGYHGTYLIEIAGLLKEKKGDSLLKGEESDVLKEMNEFAVGSLLEKIKQDLKDFGVTFDEYFSEQTLFDKKLIEKTLKVLDAQGLLYESEGALWFRSTKFGDDKDRVLRKQNGEYAYLAPDIAYHQTKFDRGFEKMINLWGPDHHGYIPRMKAAIKALGHPDDAVKILIVQLATLYRGGELVRMSTRQGTFVTLRELMDEVGMDATRFFFLMRKVESHLNFDLELAKSKSEENPVYYVQYAHARICSVLTFARRKMKPDTDLSLIKEPEALELAKKLLAYPEALQLAADHLEPYRVTDYLRELAAAFHQFYAVHRVVSEENALTDARLFLIDCVRIVLRNGLNILGVSAPVTM